MAGQLIPVSKRGEWKTIDQRERSAAKARKTQRRGEAAVSVGTGTAAGTYLAGRNKGAWNGKPGGGRTNTTMDEVKSLSRAPKLMRGQGLGLRDKLRYAGFAARNRPMGATFIGGGALAGVGSAGMLQGSAREGYHQTKINSRRKANMSKRAPFDHEGSGYARYGNFSGVGRRLPDEFSKAAPPDKTQVSKRIRNKDAEDDRQRRLGAGVAATGIGSALLLRRGYRGVATSTKHLRGSGLEASSGAWKKLDPSVQRLINRTKDGKPVKGRGIAMESKDAANLAGGAALGAGSLGLGHHARSRRNHRWE